MKSQPEYFMTEALKEAKKGCNNNEVPVGAVIVKNNKIIARAYSKVNILKDPTAHAEMRAIQKAAKKLKNERLKDCSIYVTIEPCAMCAGALVLSRVDKLIYGALEPKTGAVKSVFKIASGKKLNHRIKITGGILQEECAYIMRKFFKERREKHLRLTNGN
ncbi:MAG: tRNA adenosine(34) deaminase TadA [Candidatus Firestonebacteria bacterium]